MLLCIAHDPGMRLRDLAASLGITERSAHGIVTDLAAAGYVVKHKDGRRNRYQIQAHLPLPNPPAKNPPSARCWPSSPAPARRAQLPRSPEPATCRQSSGQVPRRQINGWEVRQMNKAMVCRRSRWLVPLR